MYPVYRRLFLFLLACLLFSCEKDELTQPAKVSFRFKLDRTPPTGRPVSFQAGALDIESIEFTGDRETGEDVTFISDLQTIVHADLATGNTDPIIAFDVPQGTYGKINLALNPDTLEPDIVVTGSYVPALLGPEIPVQLEINIPGQLNVVAKNAEGGSKIVLTKDRNAIIEIFLNPSSWFNEIPVASLETAQLKMVGGVPSIVISKDVNEEMYFKLANLIEVSAEAVLR